MTDNGNKPATQAGLAEVKTELKADIKAVKADVETVKADQQTLKADNKRLDQKSDRIAAELIKTQDEVRQIKETMATKADSERIIGLLDFIKGKVSDQDRTVVVFDKILGEHRVRLEEHDKRIGVLESGRD